MNLRLFVTAEVSNMQFICESGFCQMKLQKSPYIRWGETI